MRPLKPRTRDALLTSAVLLQLAYAWMFSQVSVPNERTRAYLTIALREQHALAIDAPVRRFGSVYDMARFGGHFFTDKAPGASLLALPAYALARLGTPADAWNVVDVVNLARTCVMLPIGLLGFLILRSLLRALGVSEVAVDVSSLGFSLGSAMLHYSAAFYGHAIVSVLVLACLRCLACAGVFDATQEAPRSQRRQLLWTCAAGSCAGLAGLTEYQAVILAGLLALPVALSGQRGRSQQLLCFVLGASPFAVMLLAYNASAFGGVFALGYQHLVASSLQDLHGNGLVGATHPSWRALVGLLFSQHRGLLLTAPLLGLGLCALPASFRLLPRALFVTMCAGVSYFLLIVASSSVWFGGWSYGPRLLLPIAGLLALAAAYALDAWHSDVVQVLGRAAAISGIVLNQAVAATFPELPETFTRPLADSVLPLLEAGLTAPNLGCKFALAAPLQWLPLGVVLALTLGFVAFRGLASKPALLSLACAGCLIAALASASPSIGSSEQTRWLGQVRAWHAGETRCAEPHAAVLSPRLRR
jgi:hypothetical protein